MTDLTPIKTLLVAAFNAQGEASGFSEYVFDRGDGNITLDGRFNLDRLATTIHDHFLNREKVRAALIYAFSGPGGDSEMLAECRADWTVDRLIASLVGGSQ